MSSETVATAALGTYDIYKAYINPTANSAQLVRVSHIIVIVFGVVVAAISVAFNHAGYIHPLDLDLSSLDLQSRSY